MRCAASSKQLQTYHINGVNVGKLGEELATAEGELGVGLEELLSGETKPDMRMTRLGSRRRQKRRLRTDDIRSRRDWRKSRNEVVREGV